MLSPCGFVGRIVKGERWLVETDAVVGQREAFKNYGTGLLGDLSRLQRGRRIWEILIPA